MGDDLIRAFCPACGWFGVINYDDAKCTKCNYNHVIKDGEYVQLEE